MMRSQRDVGLDNLLALHGEVYDQGGGYWVRIEAWQAQPSEHVPHGIRYALTLHNRYVARLMGYDNAHAVKPSRRKRYAGRRLACDHRHRHARDKGVAYEFTNADQLLKDFFDEVDRVLNEAES